MSPESEKTTENTTDAATSKSLALFLTQATVVAGLSFLLLFGGIGWAMFDEPIDGLALGLFAALWGGPGFAAISAGVLWGHDEDQPHPSEQPAASPAPRNANIRQAGRAKPVGTLG